MSVHTINDMNNVNNWIIPLMNKERQDSEVLCGTCSEQMRKLAEKN